MFNVRNVGETLRDMAEASMRQVVGDHSVTEVLTIGRESIQVSAKEALQGLCDRYHTGIEIRQLVLQDVNPPKPVQDSFNEVNQAIQERERLINQAWARYNSVIPEARGKAEQTIQAAEGYATERVNKSRGDAQRFVAMQEEYAKAPVVTRTRLYLETMTGVLPAAKRRIFVDDQIKGLLPLLPLDSPALGGKR
jgi:membrane protease subunit HflK